MYSTFPEKKTIELILQSLHWKMLFVQIVLQYNFKNKSINHFLHTYTDGLQLS